AVVVTGVAEVFASGLGLVFAAGVVAGVVAAVPVAGLASWLWWRREVQRMRVARAAAEAALADEQQLSRRLGDALDGLDPAVKAAVFEELFSPRARHSKQEAAAARAESPLDHSPLRCRRDVQCSRVARAAAESALAHAPQLSRRPGVALDGLAPAVKAAGCEALSSPRGRHSTKEAAAARAEQLLEHRRLHGRVEPVQG